MKLQSDSLKKIAFTTFAVSLILVAPAFCDDTTEKNELQLQTPEPVTPMEHNNRAVELGSKGRWDLAIPEHEIAVKLEEREAQDKSKANASMTFRQNLSSACLRYGDVLMHEKKYDDAKKFYEKALTADSKNKPAQSRLAQILGMNSETDKETSGKVSDGTTQKTPASDTTKSK